MIVSGLYFILLLLSVFATYSLLVKIVSRHSGYYVMLFTMITIVCLAYFSYSIAADTGMALVANQFSVLDGTFVLMLFMFCILDLSHTRVHKIYGIAMLTISVSLLIIAFTSAYHKLFYTHYEIGFNYNAAHLITEVGPVYNLYVIYVAVSALIPLGVLVYSFFVKRKISYKYTLALALVFVAIFMIYVIEGITGLGMDLLPVGYVIMEYVILMIVHRIGLYDVTEVAKDTSENNKEYGYIIFDKEKCYVGASDVAKYYFPELDTLDIDRKVTNPFVKTEFVDWIDVELQGNTSQKVYERQNRKIVLSTKMYTSGRKNKIYGYIIEIHDDTEQQNFIETLNELNEQLSKAVEDANNANMSKSQFLANMSHEIRTPINAIMGMNQIAIRECEDENVKKYMEDIENASVNLLAIINDILDISKIEAGKVEIVEDKYYTGKLIKDVSDLIGIKAKDKGLDYIVNVSEKFPKYLYGDENRIRQVMVNLLNNAVKYTQSGRVELSVSTENEDASKCCLVITVKDSGIGIKEEDISVLFEAFSRVDGKKNKNVEGTGLGLAITNKFVTRMNGTIDVESEYGKGSVFTVKIPQGIIDGTLLDNYENEQGEAVKKQVEVLDAEGINILVVDDNVVNLKVAQGLLKLSKANITTCKSGAECLELLKCNEYKIVLLDHLMPEMDGIETLNKAKSMEDNLSKDAVYIALTANAIAGIEEQYINAGFDDYISKPIRIEMLNKTLGKYT